MKSRYLWALAIIFTVILFGGFPAQVCATVEREVKIRSEPSGADVFLSRGRKRIPLGKTPLVSKLEFHSNISVIRMVFKKRGYKESTVKVKATQDIVTAMLQPIAITQQAGSHKDPYLAKLQKKLNPTINKILPPLLEKQYQVAFRLSGPINVTRKHGNAYLILPFVIEDFKESVKGSKKDRQTRILKILWRELGVNIAVPLAEGIKIYKEVKGVILDTRFDDTIFTHKVSPKVKSKQEMECVPGNRTQMVLQFRQVPYYRTEYRNGVSTQVFAGYKSESSLVPQEVYDPCLYRRPVTKSYTAFESKLEQQKNQSRALFLLRPEVLKKSGRRDDIYSQLSILLNDASGERLVSQGSIPNLPTY